MYRKSGTESLGLRLGNKATVVQSENVFGKLVDQLHKLVGTALPSFPDSPGNEARATGLQ